MKNDYGQRFNVSNCYALALFSFPSSSQSSASTSSTPATSTSTGDFTGALSLSYPSYLPVKAPRCRPLETPSKPTSGNTLEADLWKHPRIGDDFCQQHPRPPLFSFYICGSANADVKQEHRSNGRGKSGDEALFAPHELLLSSCSSRSQLKRAQKLLLRIKPGCLRIWTANFFSGKRKTLEVCVLGAFRLL
ncbi:hypothetical protein LXL04_008970 [Taraxacum kok-saghyz]